MKKSVLYALMFLVFALIVSLGVTYADNEQVRLDEINSKISQTQKQLNEGKKKEKALNKQIKALETQINSAEKEIASLANDIENTEQNIAIVRQNLEAVEQEMALQNDNLNKRLRAMYKNGDIGLVEILLGSEDITDFMSNFDLIQKIFDNDVETLKSMEEQFKKIELQKEQLAALQAQLQSKKQTEAEKQTNLQASRGSLAELRDQVVIDNKELERQEDALNAEADRIVAEIKALQGDAAYTGGKLEWPVPGYSRISSGFGYRIHPILKVKKLHTGYDIPAPTGTNIIAANSGTVIKAAYNSSYGNVIMIDHGGGIVTLYAHNSKFAVKVGDVVARGQVIAYAGSTGLSTGPHLHFEVRVDGKYQNPGNWL